MKRGRSISKGLCVAGLLACVVGVIAPAAYGGEGVVDDAAGTLSTDTSGVTEVTETAPTVEETTEEVTGEVATSTTPVTEAVDDTTEEAPATTVETTDIKVAASTSTATVGDTTGGSAASSTEDAANLPASNEITSGSGADGSSTAGDTGGGSGGSGNTSAGPVTTAPDPASSPQQGMWTSGSSSVSSTQSGPFRTFPRTLLAAAGESPDELLDELLGIGNTVGVDEVRGLQVTSARGEPAAPESPGASAPAPLALTGIAVGAFLAIGLVLVATGNGARAAGSTSTA